MKRDDDNHGRGFEPIMALPLGTSLGLLIGIIVGSMLGNVPLGVGIGIAIGSGLGGAGYALLEDGHEGSD